MKQCIHDIYKILKDDSIIDYLDGFKIFFRESANIEFKDKLNQLVSETPSYAKEVINESNFFENNNVVNKQIIKKKISLFSKISNNSKTFCFSRFSIVEVLRLSAISAVSNNVSLVKSFSITLLLLVLISAKPMP